MNTTLLTKSCELCEAEYSKPRSCSVKDWSSRKFCSTRCGNKGKNSEHLKYYQIKKGQNLSSHTQFKKGQNKSSDNATWKGMDASYAAKHIWMRNNYGKPQFCEHCFTTEDRMYHWANISGEYKRERTDWLRLCVPCHKIFDQREH